MLRRVPSIDKPHPAFRCDEACDDQAEANRDSARIPVSPFADGQYEGKPPLNV